MDLYEQMSIAAAIFAEDKASDARCEIPCVRITEAGRTAWAYRIDPASSAGFRSRLLELRIDVDKIIEEDDYLIVLSVVDSVDPSSRLGHASMSLDPGSKGRGIALVEWDRDPGRP
jgi:hypothetical protein